MKLQVELELWFQLWTISGFAIWFENPLMRIFANGSYKPGFTYRQYSGSLWMLPTTNSKEAKWNTGASMVRNHMTAPDRAREHCLYVIPPVIEHSSWPSDRYIAEILQNSSTCIVLRSSSWIWISAYPISGLYIPLTQMKDLRWSTQHREGGNVVIVAGGRTVIVRNAWLECGVESQPLSEDGMVLKSPCWD